MILFSLNNGRRTDPVDQAALASVVQEQFVVNRGVLSQQLDARHSSRAASSYYRSRFGALPGGGMVGGPFGMPPGALLGRGAVGYQPVITQLPSGSMLQVNHATTADRMYVLISASPLFTQVGDVTTFTFFGGGGGGGGVGGGGLGGGGLGGGGLGGGGLGGGGGGLGGGGLGGGGLGGGGLGGGGLGGGGGGLGGGLF